MGTWLDEADQIDRVRKLSDPETRQFQIEQAEEEEVESDSTEGTDSTDLSVSDSDALANAKAAKKDRKKKGPGKLPKDYQKSMTEDSREAADDALKRFFSGR